MGSTLSAIRDDEENYRNICSKYGETPVGVYSKHAGYLERAHTDICNYTKKRMEEFQEAYSLDMDEEEKKRRQRELIRRQKKDAVKEKVKGVLNYEELDLLRGLARDHQI